MKTKPATSSSTADPPPPTLSLQALPDPRPGPALPAALSQLVPLSPSLPPFQAAPLIEAKPVSPPAQPRKIRRNGRIACLPRLQREMVNHMLWNAVPYKNIVAALDEEGFTVTERNISNWATGGYLEWSLAQEHVLENRLDQDQLLDFLRRDDAPELPEVGLQAAATRLSQIMLQKTLHADTADLDLDKISKLVDLLCRLNRELVPLQKQRDDSRLSLGPEYNPARVKEEEQLSAIENERFYSNPPPDSALSRPSEPPALPPIPTASCLARQAAEDRHDAQIEHMKRTAEMLKLITGKQPTPSNTPPAPSANPPHQSTNPAIQPSNSPAAAPVTPR